MGLDRGPYHGSDPHRVGGSGGRPRAAWPLWARWNDELGQRYSLGVEEEVMLLDPTDWSLAQSSDRVLEQLSDGLSARAFPETHAAVIELATGIHSDVHGVVAELASLRNQLAYELGEMGLSVAAAGTHPLTVGAETEVSSRRHLPVLLALSANSPFWRGRDSGFASARTLIFQAFPRAGLPPCFADYADYVKSIDPLIAYGAIPDPSFLWWDVRLQPALGTVEVRVMDAQSQTRDVTPLVALIQSLACLELEEAPPSVVPSPEVLAENRFLAARDGMDARLIDAEAGCLVPLREALDSLLTDCREAAVRLGCGGVLDRVQHLADTNGAERQRRFVTLNPRLDHLVISLAARFLAPRSHSTTDARNGHTAQKPTERSGQCAAGSHTPARRS